MATVKQHIENAAQRVEQVVQDITDAFESFKAKYRAAVEAASQPQPVQVDNADAEFQQLDTALSQLGTLSSNLRGAVSTLDQGGTGATQVGGATTSAAGGAGATPTPPSGSQETGPSGQAPLSSQMQEAGQVTATDATQTTDPSASATDTGGGQGATGTGVLIGDNS